MKFRFFELALLLALALGIFGTVQLNREQQSLSDKLIRLHVVADSDSAEDQRLKLLARDAVLEKTDALLQNANSREQAAEILTDHLSELAEAARTRLAAEGCDDDVDASLAMEESPTKVYDTFSLPAGRYLALRVTIGEGGGHNWWCVLYPPLCLAQALDSRSAGALTDEEIALISDGSRPYVLRFRCMEIAAKLRQTFSWDS